MPDQVDPTHKQGPTAELKPEPASAETDLQDLESYLIGVLQTTHPLRLGLALHRVEEEARASWPREQVTGVFERAILLALRHDDT
jgi:hypothetical protein